MKTYIKLIYNYLENKISVKEFQERFLDLYISDKILMTRKQLEIINNLYIDVNNFCNNPEKLTFQNINKAELKNSAEKTLGAIGGLLLADLDEII